MKIAVIGTGYVGLVTGTCFADCGNEVICVDKDEKKIARLDRGDMPIYEPGLKELVLRNVREGRLKFTTNLSSGVLPAQLIFIAVGTPQSADGSADLSTLWAVTDALAATINGHKIVVIKSTVPVGTNQIVFEQLSAKCKHAVDVASNPEFLKEGAAIDDCTKPDRVVVGVRRPEVAAVLRELYAPFLRTERPFLAMSPESAEMTKYVANAMLATKISFINEMANLCERMGADINDVRRGIGHDARIGFQFLFPGAGYGGSCFSSDESIFVLNSPMVATEPLERVFAGPGERFQGDLVEVLAPANKQVLAFDLQTRQPTLADVKAVTRRPYRGVMVQLKTSMGRRLSVTADHPVILHTEQGLSLVPADTVKVGDQLLTLCSLPAVEQAEKLDLIERLQGDPLEADVHVSPTDDSFTAMYPRFARHVPAAILKYPDEIKQHNRMPLRLFRLLRDQGHLEVSAEKLQLYTAKGAATKLNALLAVDADLLRLCGYYLAEGYISQDVGRAGAIRHRAGFTFHENEIGYIEDVRRILQRWGLKWNERRASHAVTTMVSSRVFAWLLRDVLQCGVRSEDKRLPRLVFNVSAELRFELLRGAFSGDGAITPVQQGKNLMFEYATVSRLLADGLALLLQSLGVVPALLRRWMNKSKRLAHLVRVTGYSQMAQLRNVFGDKHRERIDTILAGYQRHIKQHGFTRHGSYALLTVRSVELQEVETSVYSVETSSGTVIASSGLICHNCFPKDIRALLFMAQTMGTPAAMMEAVDRVNEAQKHVLAEKIQKHYGASLKEKTLAIWGLAFKPRTDDVREAPALVLLDFLLAQGVKVRVHDPEAMPNVRAQYGDRLVYCDRPYGALEGADGLVIVTEWQEFRNPDFEVMRRLLRHRVIFDGRNLYEVKTPVSFGFTYHSIGRASCVPENQEG